MAESVSVVFMVRCILAGRMGVGKKKICGVWLQLVGKEGIIKKCKKM